MQGMRYFWFWCIELDLFKIVTGMQCKILMYSFISMPMVTTNTASVLTEKYNGKQTALIKHKKVYEHDAWLSKHM